MTTAPRKRDGATPRSAKTRIARTRIAKTRIAEIVVVCTKCAKRQGLRPRDVRDLLKGAAKAAARDGRLPGRAKVRVVESGCLGPCPKRALAVATGASVAAGRVLLLDPAAGPEAALAAILPAASLPAASLAVTSPAAASPARAVLPEGAPPNSAPMPT